MKQCKSCLTKAKSTDGLCPICGIEQEKVLAELSPPQKCIRRAARHIRLVAILHVLGGIIGIMMLPEFAEWWLITALIAISSILAVGLIRFSFWAYRGAIVIYFVLGMVNIVTVNVVGIAVMLLLLYLVGNGAAKAVFERRAREYS